MSAVRGFLARVVGVFRGHNGDANLREELEAHLDLATAEHIRRGMTPEAARREAQRAAGGLARAAESVRDQRGLPRVERLATDLRQSFRGLRRSPALTIVVVLTLALGIGANVAILRILDNVLLRPISLLRDPGTVNRIYLQRTDRRGTRITHHSMSYGRYLDLRNWTSSFSHAAVSSERLLAVGSGEATRERYVNGVSASYFEFFNAAPALGRFFSADEDVPPAGAAVAIISWELWQGEFGGGPVLGSQLDVGSVRTTIVGVTPRGFTGIHDENPPAVFIPAATLAAAQDVRDPVAANFYGYYRFDWANVLVRRAPGVTEAQATADVHQAYQRSWMAERSLMPESVLPIETAVPMGMVGHLRRAGGPSPLPEVRIAIWATGVGIIVLLIACANVANLLLARALSREQETVVRLALGVSRRQLARQVLIESLLLALLGGLGALAVSEAGTGTIRRLLLPMTDPVFVALDARAVVLTFVIVLLVGLVTGAVPAFLATRTELASRLRSRVQGHTRQGRRVRGGLLVTQIALSVALLVGTLLFVRSLLAIRAVPQGYRLDQVLVVNPIMRGTTLDTTQAQQLRERLLTDVHVIPGVERASWANAAPLWRSAQWPVFVAGIDSTAPLGVFNAYVVDTAYFQVMGTRILRGRGISALDRLGAPATVVVSDRMARVLWPGRDPLGECLRIGADTMPCTTVVGISDDVLQTGQYQSDTPRYQFYVSMAQNPSANIGYLLFRADGDPVRLVETARRALQGSMPGASYLTIEPMRGLLDQVQRQWRVGTMLFVVYGGLALLVAAIGLYGVIAYDVTERTRELGIRIALGAQRGAIIRFVVRQGALFGAVGIGLGAVLSLVASPRLQPLLYRQSVSDPMVYAAVAGLILLIVVVASVGPAARAARSDPNTALRTE